jgi:hypothetical protein
MQGTRWSSPVFGSTLSKKERKRLERIATDLVGVIWSVVAFLGVSRLLRHQKKHWIDSSEKLMTMCYLLYTLRFIYFSLRHVAFKTWCDKMYLLAVWWKLRLGFMWCSDEYSVCTVNCLALNSSPTPARINDALKVPSGS